MTGWLRTIAIALLVCAVTSAQDPGQQQVRKRPRIGLVLEGGGALGLAHVGAIQWLEEHHIPVDYVAGTSMGGLVGGFYAMGMSPGELRQLLGGLDWNELIGGRTPFEDLSFRRKEDRRQWPAMIEFGIDHHRLSLPSGLNAGQQISVLFDQQTLAYNGLKTFDDLPIPFRCVATDLGTSKQVVFHDGSLSLALRSTMSLPAIFTPVKYGDTYLVDGGILNNLPVDIAKDMGADIIIAVYLDVPPEKMTQAPSLTGVLGKTVGVVVAASEFKNMKAADVLISADLKGFTAMDYNRWQDLIPKGYEGAQIKASMLSAFALNPQEWQEYLAAREAKKRKAPTMVASVHVTGVSANEARGIEEELADQTGKPLDAKGLEETLTEIRGTGRFSTLGYELRDNGELVVRAQPREGGKDFFIPGILIDGSQRNNFHFAFGGRLTLMDIGGYPSEWRTDFFLGQQTQLVTEYWRPLNSRTRWFVAPRGFVGSEWLNYYINGRPVATYQVGKGGGAGDVGYSINRFSEFRAGYEIGVEHAETVIGDPYLPSISGRYGMVTSRYVYDGLDDPFIPRRGFYVLPLYRWYEKDPLSPEQYSQAEVRFSAFKPVSRSGSVFVLGQGGNTFNGVQPRGLSQFTLGGAFHMGAYGPGELRGYRDWYAGGGYLHQLKELSPLVGGRVAVAGWYEVGRMYGSSYGTVQDFSGGLIVNTIIGPILVGGSVGNNSRNAWYFRMGKIF